VIRIINAFVQWYAIDVAHKTKSKVDDQFLPMIRRVVTGVVLLISLVWILGAFGVEITALIATMGVGGIAIALALQDTLKEFFSGAHVILDKPIKIGDFIELESGDKGTVTDIGWRSTTIKTFSRNYVIIPNSKLASSKLINYDQPKQEVGFSVDGGIGYHEDLDRVEKVLVDEAKKVMKKMGTGASDFEPFVRYQEFGDSNINFKVVFRVKTYADQFALKHEFMKDIKKRFDKEGIEISWPVRKVYTHKGRGK
jgi:small-conductance mechanosensitive channel